MGGGLLPSFALVALASWAGASGDLEPALRANGASIMLPARDAESGAIRVEPIPAAALSEGTWRVDFAGLPGAITAFPSNPLVRMARSGITPAADNPFRGKIVLVGAVFSESRDIHPTPVGPMTGGGIARRGPVPAVEGQVSSASP
jgi:CHASE2 domain-containing sensor protein